MGTNFKRNLIISSGVSMLILIVSSTASYLSIKSLVNSNSWVRHTQEVISNINTASAILTDAQTSMRGFLITGKEDYLQQYTNSELVVDTYFDKLERLSLDSESQQQKLKELRPLKTKFFKYLELRVKEKRAGKPVNYFDLDNGKILMNEMRLIFKRMELEEQRLLKLRQSDSATYSSYSIKLIIAAALIALLISIVFFMRILNDYKERLKLSQELEKNDRDTTRRIETISTVSSQIANGNFEIRVDDKESDALGSVAGSLNNMALALQSSFSKLSDKEWLQAGIAQLNNVMLGEKSTEQLSRDVLTFLSEYTNSNAGMIYVLEGDDLHAIAGYGCVPKVNNNRLRKGEGLTGQAVASGKVMELKSIASKDITISYAMGEIKPTHIVAIPLIDNEIMGVVELASIKDHSDLVMEFFENIGNNIGIALKASQNRKRLQELLEETEAQSEELRIQHSELESMNAELETQTEKLQASEEELKVQQEELQQTNEELGERSVLLEEQNTEIQKKSEALELSTRYKSEFLANMSHELRTPLNSILLLSRLLSENNDQNMNEEQIEFAKVIQSSGNGLLGLIDEILDLSKIEAGKMELEFTDISIKEITDGMQDLFSELAKQKGIAFKIITKNAPLVIKTDKMRLEQIIKNLISNAIKFTAEGSVTLEISKHETDKNLIYFTVTDTGIGIPLDQQPLIFEAFQQADGSTKRKYGGTGLGLSISRELAKLLRGEITLTSTIGEGSAFTLRVPVSGSSKTMATYIASESYDAVAIQTPKAMPAIEEKYLSTLIPDDVPDDRETISDGDKVILIVEDDVNFAQSLLTYTRKKGYKGIVTVRGDQALNLAMVYKPLGILLDIVLPIKSGWDVMEELKNNWQTKHIPVHIMSSNKVRQESLLKGAVDFLDKPAAIEKMNEVFEKIEYIINRKSQKVLIIEDNPKHAKALAFFLETNSINSEIKSDASEGVAALQQTGLDCVILDMGIPDQQAYEILENVKKNVGLETLPVIVFTGKSLSLKEELRIKKYADSIVVKTAHSYQRMLDEVSLFLHLVEEKKSNVKKGSYNKLNSLNNILNGKTVLVVDDDVRNIYSLTKALEVLKMNVITAIDGKEALNVLSQHPETDIVLLDMMMPNMDGYETAKHIRENKNLKNLPVIAVTAKAMTGDREKCINAGASDYITKPVDVDQLLSLLRVWLYDKN